MGVMTVLHVVTTLVIQAFLHKSRMRWKWTYFLMLDTEGIVLRALIQDVIFFSRYKMIEPELKV